MLCQHCKKQQATVNYVEIINGNRFESHLCAKCNAELYGELNTKSNGALWAELFGSSVSKEKVCPVCGMRYSEYECSGLLGCASCYDMFKEELLPAISKIQGKVTHVGKSGENKDELGLHRRLKALQEQVETAMREKKFKKADELNKKIDEIKKILYGGNNNA